MGGTGEFQFTPGENESSPSLSRPYAIALHPDGRLFITDSDNHLIRVWHLQKQEMSLLAGNGKAEFSRRWERPLAEQSKLPVRSCPGLPWARIHRGYLQSPYPRRGK